MHAPPSSSADHVSIPCHRECNRYGKLLPSGLRRNSGGICVGGSSTIAGALAEKRRGRQFGVVGSAHDHRTLDLRGWTVADAGLLSRAQGCLLGLIASDSLGSAVEFQSASQIAREYPDGVRRLKDGGTWGTMAGQPTDDSELALALARSLVEHGRYDDNAVARAYGGWYSSAPFDIGTTTAQAFSAAAHAPSKPASVARNAANRSSQANGALMRIAPLAVFGWDMSTEKLARLARKDAALSHPHRVCQDANAVFVIAIQRALKSGGSGADVYAFVRDWARNEGVCDDVFQWLCAAEKEPPADFLHQMGWVKTAFQNSFYQLLHASSFEEGVVDTVGRGGDTDTNACAAGALLGAVHGVEAVSFQWRDRVLTCRPMAGIPGVRRPRPAQHWPADAMALAELLPACGRRGEKSRASGRSRLVRSR